MTKIIHMALLTLQMCVASLCIVTLGGIYGPIRTCGSAFLSPSDTCVPNGWRPAKPAHYCPSLTVCSHSHLSCCLVFYFSASLDYPFASFGLAVIGCILSIKRWGFYTALSPSESPCMKERDESEMTAQFKAVTDWHRTKGPCHTLGRSLLPGDLAPWGQAVSCFWVSGSYFLLN